MTEDREMARRLQSSWQRGSSSTAVSGRAMPGAEGRSSDTSGISNAQEKPAAVCRPETSSTAARAARKFAFSSLAEVEVRVQHQGLDCFSCEVFSYVLQLSGRAGRAILLILSDVARARDGQSWESARSGCEVRAAANDDIDLRDAATMLLDAQQLSKRHHGSGNREAETKACERSMTAAKAPSLHIGARLEVLFDNAKGEQKWYEGRVTKRKGESSWQVLFADGEEHTVRWPDNTGEVRLLPCLHPLPSAERSVRQSTARWDEDTLKYAAGLLLIAAAKSQLVAR
jgi:hypothetical protein